MTNTELTERKIIAKTAKNRLIYETYHQNKQDKWVYSYTWATLDEAQNQAKKLEESFLMPTKIIELVL